MFSNFEIPMFFICSMYMCYQHAMSISHMAVSSVNCEYGTLPTIQLDISHLFTQLNGQTIQLLTIRFSISHLLALSLNVKQFYLNYSEDPIRCFHSGWEWTWEQWQWKDTTHSQKRQDWSLTIRLVNVIIRTLIGVWRGVLPLRRDAVGVFYCPSRLGW